MLKSSFLYYYTISIFTHSPVEIAENEPAAVWLSEITVITEVANYCLAMFLLSQTFNLTKREFRAATCGFVFQFSLRSVWICNFNVL